MRWKKATKVSYSATTNGSGYYAITFIKPGTYDVTVQPEQASRQRPRRAFPSPTTRPCVQTSPFPSVRLTDTVSVSASTPPLSTDDATLGETFGTKMVEDLPLNGHNALEIAALSSNVQDRVEDLLSRACHPARRFSGGRSAGNPKQPYPRRRFDHEQPDHRPPPRAPAAMSSRKCRCKAATIRRSTAAYLGIHINLVSKSGTNDIHGAVV